MEKQPLLEPRPSKGERYTLVIHGGAGTMSKQGSTSEQQAAYKAALTAALEVGYNILREGGEAMDAVVAAVTSMEDNPLFNSGKGAVFNVDGKNELEASIMLSKPPASHPDIPLSRRGLGLTLLTRARNPSQLVRALYLAPSLVPHTFLSGATAEAIGAGLGAELVAPSYFFTEHRWKEHRRGLGLPEEPLPATIIQRDLKDIPPLDQLPTGTVGAVALDVRGCIAALTSTGGRTNKLVGRIGDTPSMGSGFWAEEWLTKRGHILSWPREILNKVFRRKHQPSAIGVSGTGDGDYFIRLASAVTIARRVRYLHEPLEKAAQAAVNDLLVEGGIGGIIALDDMGNVAMPLNCPGMYRGVIREDGVPKTAIFDDDLLDCTFNPLSSSGVAFMSVTLSRQVRNFGLDCPCRTKYKRMMITDTLPSFEEKIQYPLLTPDLDIIK
ncbi:putative isoaspartyl peptidase/L-asparaginase [Hypsizygus marmoreus]|uniref:Isoaspartyl peptidase/L-asparaginase n=1 Tax=Hypsizygus marmoreus TaxID=39966 RepID=A0A369K189_HYPMA|nr:putative isoaspartyl peptidase/L-asparaginase [Hypsizygus marmoreus]